MLRSALVEAELVLEDPDQDKRKRVQAQDRKAINDAVRGPEGEQADDDLHEEDRDGLRGELPRLTTDKKNDVSADRPSSTRYTTVTKLPTRSSA
jgi:hypothetical protein